MIDPPKGTCNQARCSNPVRTGNLKCHKCIMRKYRAADLIRQRFNVCRDRAAKKGREFSIALDEFTQWAKDHLLIENDLTVDRKNALLGYVSGNLSALTFEANVAKGNRERHHPYEFPF